MSEQEQINAGLAVAAIKLMVRAGTISEAAVVALAREYDLLADRSPYAHEAEIQRGIAHQLRAILLDLDPPPAIDPASERRAQFLREQMKERTAMIADRSGE
ncbi:hypothetical protein GCM10011380_00670 [Sphingomonas metalli]|uniref:Uncharacterized protein n=1 Tax=Sphingomonas metalli TaxID=1779358 RepID=A0A916WM48_9SPHN|nr:hypothetical protein [Sphingomonas metalli]GGB15124.1 hypothetical protein GCM10011380_00670 [Sphingomonas metalli]